MKPLLLAFSALGLIACSATTVDDQSHPLIIDTPMDDSSFDSQPSAESAREFDPLEAPWLPGPGDFPSGSAGNDDTTQCFYRMRVREVEGLYAGAEGVVTFFGSLILVSSLDLLDPNAIEQIEVDERFGRNRQIGRAENISPGTTLEVRLPRDAPETAGHLLIDDDTYLTQQFQTRLTGGALWRYTDGTGVQLDCENDHEITLDFGGGYTPDGADLGLHRSVRITFDLF